jgi:hypothetical protein
MDAFGKYVKIFIFLVILPKSINSNQKKIDDGQQLHQHCITTTYPLSEQFQHPIGMLQKTKNKKKPLTCIHMAAYFPGLVLRTKYIWRE